MVKKKEDKAAKAEAANDAVGEKPKAADAGAKPVGTVVKAGDNVKVEYTGSFDDGRVFDSSEKHKKPLPFQAGAKQVIPGFDNAVIGMKLGEEKTIKIQPEEAYGMPRPELVQKVPKEQLPKEQEPKVGMILLIGLPNGHQVPAKITGVTDKEVTIDLNHPLAGKVLNFKLKVVGIN
ncbi:peptidylprolyl isomerase [Candidatus Woesearchaeota archaeon]|nr:peptidylprolyl isomerase [Candidatus Woesearchaeota archaeon]